MAIGNIENNIPSTPNTVSDSWQPLVEQHLICRQGDNHISLTEWSSSTTVPQVSSGSSIEVNGSLITYASNTTLTNDVGLTSGTVYLLIDISDAVNSFPTLVNDTPVWNASKNGFYRGANERYTGHQMTWDGAASYTLKAMFFDNDSGLNFLHYADGSLNFSGKLNVPELEIVGKISEVESSQWTGSETTKTFSGSATWVIPKGLYMIFTNSSALSHQVKHGGTWRLSSLSGIQGSHKLIASDGVNMKFLNTSGSAQTLYYRKLII